MLSRQERKESADIVGVEGTARREHPQQGAKLGPENGQALRQEIAYAFAGVGKPWTGNAIA